MVLWIGGARLRSVGLVAARLRTDKSSRGGRMRERGQALVELAIVTIVMLFLLVGAIDLGRVFYSRITVTNAAKEAALVASQGATTAVSQAAAVEDAKSGFVTVGAADVAITTPCPSEPKVGGATVKVVVSVNFQPLTPIVSAALGGSNVPIVGVAEAECRYAPDFGPLASPPAPSASVGPSAAPTPVAGTPCSPPPGGVWQLGPSGWKCKKP